MIDIFYLKNTFRVIDDKRCKNHYKNLVQAQYFLFYFLILFLPSDTVHQLVEQRHTDLQRKVKTSQKVYFLSKFLYRSKIPAICVYSKITMSLSLRTKRIGRLLM